MKKSLFSWMLLAASVVFLIIGFSAPFHYVSEGGIVGGSGKPTYWLIMLSWRYMNGWPMCYILFGGAMLLTAFFRLLFPDEVAKYCPKSTTLVTFGISAFGGSGLLFWFLMMITKPSSHPVAVPVYTALAVICFFCFMGLIYFYSFLRSVHESRLGVFLDVVTSILYLPAFFWTIGIAFEQAEAIYRSLK